jgi:cell division protein FtsI/penicillin-binding protein 2/cell division protein FtsW (lipid II flippase)
MKLTREEIIERRRETAAVAERAKAASRTPELVLLCAASLVAATGLWSVYRAKTANIADQQKTTLNLNRITGPQQLIPYLAMIPDPASQQFAAERIDDLVRRGARFDNVGAIARLRVTESDLAHEHGLTSIEQRMRQARQRREHRLERQASRSWWQRLIGSRPPRELSIPLLSAAEFARLKPSLRVRDAVDYRRAFELWIALFFVCFYAVHFAWRLRRFVGDQVAFPIIHVLCAIGLILMITLRDPLRDTLMFTDFVQGVLAGAAVLFLASLIDYERHFSRLSFVPLFASLLLALALGLFGTGPGVSDARVNLLFFQPVELIRILLVFFLAGYFAQNWDALRQLRQQSGPLARRFNVPRIDYVLPVVAGVLVSLALFFWLSDLGPALVIGCLFLTMYSIARNRALLAAAGLAVIVAGFVAGYAIGYPRTVTERVEMWKSPWDNPVRGGDQLADSLWSLSTGGITGTGLGLGDPALVPAAHTDLVVAGCGEEAGLLGVLALYLLYGALVYRSLRIARRARGAYSLFLVVGLTLIVAYEILLITGGLLGLIPLSGVVSPFLSYGRTSMVANFALFGVILAISARRDQKQQQENFGAGMRVLGAALAVAGVIVMARFAWVQGVKANDIVVRPTLVIQADGVRRYQYNPRILEVARDLPKGTIYDRNGIPLATSDWSLIEKYRADYQKMGVALDQTTSKDGRRQYPFGPPMFYLLGDVRTRLKQGATNTAFQEASSRVRLQGYDDVAELEETRDPVTGQITSRIKRDYRPLIPLLRHRYEPNNPQVKALFDRPRDVHMSIDAALQMRVAAILKEHLAKLGKDKGAAVVMDPATGDLLAAVSYPMPTEAQLTSLEADAQAPMPSGDLLDRARFGLYPPGSSFKIVTAMAALRKDPSLAEKHYECIRLPDGRVGNYVWGRAIRDDVEDKTPHGTVDMRKGIIVSCNAFFAQLGAESVGADMLFDTATRLGISVAQPDTAKKLHEYLPQASYGQGQVVATPFQMARVAATIADGGKAPQGRWIVDETNRRVLPPQQILPASLAEEIAGFMRGVVTSGTGRVLAKSPIPIAGKTGTAELAHAPSHAWFIGFAPYGGKSGKQIAFAVLVENGRYGGTAAAPIAGDIVAAAHQLGIL